MIRGTPRYLDKLLKRIGYRIVMGGKHHHILNQQGKRIYSFATSASCQYWEENTIRDLEKLGVFKIGTWRSIRRGVIKLT